MAIAFSLLTSGESNGTAGVATTASVSFATDSLILICVGFRTVGACTTAVTGASQTWDKALELALGNRQTAIFRAMGTGASGVLLITSTRTDTVGFTWAVIEITGVLTGANGLTAVNSVQPIDSGSLTLSGSQPTLTITGTPSAGDVTWVSIVTEDGESGLTEEAGWTNILRLIGTLETSLDTMYSRGQDQTASWTGCRTDGREAIMGGAILKASGLNVVITAEGIRVRDFVFGAAKNTQTDQASGNMEAIFHLADTVTAALVSPPNTIVTETLKVGASGLVELIGPGAALKISDTVTAAIASNTIAVAVTAEALLLADTGQVEISHDETLLLADTVSARLDPIQAAVSSESLKVQDTLTGLMGGMAVQVADENLKVVDTLTAQIIQVLQASPATETARVLDFVFGAARNTQTDRATGNMELVIRLADGAPTAILDLFVAITNEALKVQDTVAAALADMQVLVGQEVLKLADTPTTSLDPEQASPSESLKVQDSVTIGIELSVAVTTESLKVVDTVSAQLIQTLEASPASESMRVLDLVFGAARNTQTDRATGLMDDPLKLADSVTAAVGLSVLVTGESLKVQDTVTAVVGDIAVSITQEALKVADSLTSSLDPEQTGAISESCKVQDAISAALDAGVTLSESLKVQDSLSASLTVLQVLVTESLKIQDIAFVGDLLFVDVSEGLKVVDSLTAGIGTQVSPAYLDDDAFFTVPIDNRFFLVPKVNR